MKVIFMATVHGNKGDTDNDVIQKISPLTPIMIKKGEPGRIVHK